MHVWEYPTYIHRSIEHMTLHLPHNIFYFHFQKPTQLYFIIYLINDSKFDHVFNILIDFVNLEMKSRFKEWFIIIIYYSNILWTFCITVINS
jgi:hypothetical protein